MSTDQRDPDRMAYLTEQVGLILVNAMDRHAEEVTTRLGEVGERYGPDGVFGLCYAFAAVVQKLAFPTVKRGDGSLTGDMLAVQRLGGGDGDPHSLWAARFVAAYVNGDADNTNALFYGSLDDEEAHCCGVLALVAMAADLARQKEAESAS